MSWEERDYSVIGLEGRNLLSCEGRSSWRIGSSQGSGYRSRERYPCLCIRANYIPPSLPDYDGITTFIHPSISPFPSHGTKFSEFRALMGAKSSTRARFEGLLEVTTGCKSGERALSEMIQLNTGQTRRTCPDFSIRVGDTVYSL